MLCPSPALIPSRSKFRRTVRSNLYTDSDEEGDESDDQKSDLSQYERFDVGFMMDNVASVRHLSSALGIVVVPDPVYYEFLNGKKQHRGEQLILEVQYPP